MTSTSFYFLLITGTFWVGSFILLAVIGYKASDMTYQEHLFGAGLMAFGCFVFMVCHELMQLVWDVHKGRLVCEIAGYFNE